MTLYSEKGVTMPEQLLNAPASLKESDEVRSSQAVHFENEVLLLQGQNESLTKEIKMMKDLMAKGGQMPIS
jgi:hypothetical protein